MEVFGPFLDGYANVHIQLWELLRERTFAALDEHTRRKAAMTRPEEVYERAKIIRETFLASIGGLPERDCPPEAASYRPAADLIRKPERWRSSGARRNTAFRGSSAY